MLDAEHRRRDPRGRVIAAMVWRLQPSGVRAQVSQWSTVVRSLGQKKTYIDVMENVFEGIRISTDESDVRSFRDLSARRSLGGFRVFSVEVNRASHIDESDRKKDTK